MQKMKRILSIVVTVCMLVSILSTGVLALSISAKPANGTTVGQPFAPGTAGSTNFRIPGLVTLDNGRVVATIDARWSWAADAGGIDTLVSVSDDNGANWTYTFANYLGDNGNVANNQSCCFIDPAIATDGTTLYMIADLYPAGFAINSAKYYAQPGSTGFDANGHLLLRSDSENGITFGNSGYETGAKNATYGYYLDGGKIYTTAGAEVSGYTVDAYFNITGNGVNTNLFFGDSPYKPFPTDFLYMTTSTDGLNWSEPELLDLKDPEEQSYLVGPGNGTYDAVNGNMVFTAYRHTGGASGTAYECASLIWMDSEGNWKRSEDATVNSWSSEATSVVLADGTVRMFYRDGYTTLRYTDYVFDASVDNYVAVAREVNTAAVVDSGCQLTSIMYSEQVNGKDLILVAGPTSSRRINGYIYAFLVDEDNSMELAYAYNITPDFYAYSCLTELADGSIGLLYESAGSAVTFVSYDFDEIINRENDPRLTFKAVELLTGDSKTFTDNSGYYGEDDISELDTDVAELTMTGEEIVTDAAQLGSNATYSGSVIDLSDCLYTFTKGADDRWTAAAADGTVYLYPGNTTNAGYPNRDSAYSNLSIFAGYEEGTFCIMSNDCDNASQSTSYLFFDASSLRWDRVSAPGNNTLWQTSVSMMLYKRVEGAGSAEIPGYERVTSLDELVDGEYLVVRPGNDGSYYALYPNTSTANRYCQIAKLLGRTTVGHTELTFTGIAPGYTEVQVGSTVYQLTVADLTEITIDLPVGTTVTVTEPNGNYADADTSALDANVATVVLNGVNGTTSTGLSTEPVSTLTDGTYVIVNTRAGKLVNNTSASAEAGAGNMAGLRLDGSIRNFNADTAIWTFTAVSGGYTIQDVSGKYMSIASNSAGILDAAHTIHVERNGSTWVLEENNAYLNDAGGAGTTASGWQHSTARGDAGSQFDFYAYSAQSYGPSTELTFTGIRPGITELQIGRTKYIVNVTGEIHDVQLGVGEKASFVIGGDQTAADTSALNTDVAEVSMALTSVAHVSNCTGYNAQFTELSDCLYTFTAIDGGYFEVSAITADGTKVYLNHFSSGNNNPNITSPAGKIAVQTSAHTNMFKLVAQPVAGGSGAARGLHFHSEAAMPYWNRCGSDPSAKCHEYLYRPVREGETSSAEINGYVLVTDIAEIVDGGQYLIVHNDDAGALYVLHPATSTTDKFAHVAKLGLATEVTFTGVGAGETALTLPGHIFELSVSTAECQHAWGDWTFTTEPTCEEPGMMVRTCSNCGESEEQSVDALGHTAGEAVAEKQIPATCTMDGSYESVVCCVTCGEELSRETVVVPALGHDIVDGVCTRCGAGSNPFIDVPEDAFFHDSVLWAYENDIVAGTDETHFSPYGLTTRAQIVTFLWRSQNCPEPTITECPFVDLSQDYSYKAILWAYENGIAAGIDTTHFAPNQTCNRAQIVSFLWRFAGRVEPTAAENPFVDVPADSYFHTAVLWAVENGITSGVSANRFAPAKSCSRAESVCFLYRYLAG